MLKENGVARTVPLWRYMPWPVGKKRRTYGVDGTRPLGSRLGEPEQPRDAVRTLG